MTWMRIGDQKSSLFIERADPQISGSVWRCEAAAAAVGWKFAMVHDEVIVDGAEEALKQTINFAILQIPRIEMTLSEGGWLRIKRDIRGYVVVRYRLGRLSVGAAVEGEVILDTERGDAFCRYLISLLSVNPIPAQQSKSRFGPESSASEAAS